MPDPSPTVSELFKAKAVTDKQVNAAVDHRHVIRFPRRGFEAP
ncbi:hypothetical protein [Methylobacterium sp. R2-1]|nr:hypothetical protein [Methylobacterium sp. R2-1]MBB2965041.1 hypothetical protein [Methylobacterium sp. R2-1]